MLVINYNGNKPTTDYFKFSVQGNNKADTIRFVVLKKQGNLDLEDNFLVYVKCDNETGFVDKVQIESEDIKVEGNNIVVNWHLLKKHTTQSELRVSLCFEDNSEVVWQTQVFTLKIMAGVNADDEIINNYPTIIQSLQNQINKLSGGVGDVQIKKVWLSYDDKQSIRSDYLGLYDYENNKNFINDSSRIWYNFETTPISSVIEDEIKRGRFVIRLDYPIRNHNQTHLANTIQLHQSQSKQGIGSRSFALSFKGEGRQRMSTHKKTILLNSLIFINESDIKTNRYGEKYIHKKVSFIDYVNKVCCGKLQEEYIYNSFQAITNGQMNGEDTQFFEDYLLDRFSIGIPAISQNGSEISDVGSTEGSCFSGKSTAKYHLHNNSYTGEREMSSKTNGIKLNPAFSCYCLVNMVWNAITAIRIYSPYFIGKKAFTYIGGNTHYIVIDNLDKYGKTRTKKAYMSARPRCAILNDNYENNGFAFLKTFTQSDQQIKLMCKVIFEFNDYGYDKVPVFRTIITPK